MAVGRYGALFTAFEIQAQNILLWLTNQRLYIGPHVESYLAGLDDEWEKRLTRWTLAAQTVLEEGTELLLFPTEIVHPPRGTRTVPESGPIIRGKSDQRAAPDAAEHHQNAGSRDTAQPGQPRTRQTKSEVTSTTPGAAVPTPSKGGKEESLARGRRGRARESGRESRAASTGRRVETSI